MSAFYNAEYESEIDVMRVKAVYEFEADVEDLDPKAVNVKGLAVDLTKREMESLLQNKDLQADDFAYEVE